MSVCVTGSLAFDHIMVFPDSFREHILPEKVHMLSVCFSVESLETAFGGTAGNIAYSLSLLGSSPEVVATLGSDGQPYLDYLQKLGISTAGILSLADCKTAQAFITTDQDDNQIAAFYGGAMYQATLQQLTCLTTSPDIVIIAPNAAQVMVDHATLCREKGWSFWADPGQAMTVLSAEQLHSLIEGADGLFVNDYEWTLFQEKTALSQSEVFERCPVVIETKGSEGVVLHTVEASIAIPAFPDVALVDPTGAGDAFRAGFLYAVEKGMEMSSACRYACAVAAFAVEHKGTQNHRFDLPAVQMRYDLISSL